MSKTVTGTYTLRPTSYASYRSNDTWTNWFVDTSAPSDWENQLNVTTQLGDNSDSTYYNNTSVDTDQEARNCLLHLTVTSGQVPAYDYKVTQVKFYWRNKTSGATGSSRIFRIWDTIYEKHDMLGTAKSLMEDGYFGHMGYNGSTSSTSTGTTSINTYSSTYTSFVNDTIAAGLYPDRMALCVLAYKTSRWTSFNSYQLYDVWYEVSYTYEENIDVTATVKADSGTAVSGDATVQAGTTANVTFDEGTIVSLTAEPADGYVFDGWYSGGSKVAETTTYSFAISAAVFYAISHKRNLYVGDARVKEVYIGTTKIGEIYSGSEPIWKDSELLAEATGGTT